MKGANHWRDRCSEIAGRAKSDTIVDGSACAIDPGCGQFEVDIWPIARVRGRGVVEGDIERQRFAHEACGWHSENRCWHAGSKHALHWCHEQPNQQDEQNRDRQKLRAASGTIASDHLCFSLWSAEKDVKSRRKGTIAKDALAYYQVAYNQRITQLRNPASGVFCSSHMSCISTIDTAP